MENLLAIGAGDLTTGILAIIERAVAHGSPARVISQRQQGAPYL